MIKTSGFTHRLWEVLWEEEGLDTGDIAQYEQILRTNVGTMPIIKEFNKTQNMTYIKPEDDDGWNATNGSVVIGEYRIELCCYASTIAINLYQNEELLEMLVLNEFLDTNEQIDTINAEIHHLLLKKEDLLNKLKQMA